MNNLHIISLAFTIFNVNFPLTKSLERNNGGNHENINLCCLIPESNVKHDAINPQILNECYREVTGQDTFSEEDLVSAIYGDGNETDFRFGSFPGFKENRKEIIVHDSNEIICLKECIGKKLDLLDENGDLKDANIVSFVRNALSNITWLGPIQDIMIATCLTEVRNVTVNRYLGSDSESSCNPASINVTRCLFREIQLACPSDQIKDKEACKRFREQMGRYKMVSVER